MKTNKKLSLYILLGLLQFVFVLQTAQSFNDNAHVALSERAVQPDVSNLDNFLRTTLGFEFPDEIGQQLHDGKKGRVHELVQVGAVDEDFWTRPVYHFHNTRLSWNQSGLFSFFESAIA